MSTVLNIVDLSERTPELMAVAVRDSGTEFVVEVPLPSVDHSQSSWDAAQDVLHALYVGESLHPLCTQTWFEREGGGVWDERRPDVSVHFLVRPADADVFAAKLHELSRSFAEEGQEDGELTELLSGFEGELEELVAAGKAHFIELTEQYGEYVRQGEEEDPD
jgi:hypothetical protein